MGRYGCIIVERAGSDMVQATDKLARWKANIYTIPQMIQNDVSSTKIRLLLRRGHSVLYLLPTEVIDYIEANGLYLDEGPNSANAHYINHIRSDSWRSLSTPEPTPSGSGTKT